MQKAKDSTPKTNGFILDTKYVLRQIFRRKRARASRLEARAISRSPKKRVDVKHTFTVEDLEHLLAIEGSTPDAISYGDFALLGRARNAGLAKLRTHKEKPALHIIRVSDSKIRMLEKYSSIESVWGIWAPSKHAPAVDMLFTLCAIGSVSAMVTFMVMAAVL